jgi:hypothetical protein
MITPVPQQQEVDLVHSEESLPRGNLDGREVKLMNEIKGEALKVSSVVYLIAAFVLFLGISIGVCDKNWIKGSVITGSGALIGLIGSWIYKGVLENKYQEGTNLSHDNQ